MIKLLQFGPELASLWKSVLPQSPIVFPFSTYTWHRNWFATLGKDWEPNILSVNDLVIAPFARSGDRLILAGGKEGADYLDIIGSDGQKTAALPEIWNYLAQQGVKQVELYNVPEDSPTVAFFTKLREELAGKSAIEVVTEDTTPRLVLPQTWDEYLNTLPRKSRHELRRKLKKFERQFPQSTVSWANDPAHDIPTLLALMRLNPDKAAFLTPEMEQFFVLQLTDFFADLWLLLLNVNGVAAAALVAFKNAQTLLLYNSGFDENNFSGAGFYLKAQSIKIAIDKGIQEYNFLQGSERYKYELGGQDFNVYSVKITI